MLVLLVVVSGVAFYFYQQTRIYNKQDKDTTTFATQQAEAAIVARVGKLVLLPAGETPTIATVSNPDKLRDQPFFANAKEGDKMLVYTIARKVYLYDPVNNILLNVAPLNIDTTTPTTPIKQ